MSADLTDRPNRRLAADLPEEVALTVEAWIDDRPDFVPSSARKSTVTGHLDLFDITSERLENTRKLRVWLPPGYDAEENATRRYPVLYLHDGQNVFDRATSYLGTEWEADETATRLIEAKKIEPLLIVGIDHAGAARLAEYNPPFTSKGGVAHSGDRYLDFITQTVMPEVEGRYRVEPGPEHTALGGSSYGGNITLYAGMRHPDRFGALLVESPVFWAFGPGLMNLCKQHEWTQRVFVASGDSESKEAKVQAGYERGMEVLRATFTAQDLLPKRALLVVEPKATHHETSWARRLPQALEFFYGR
ncbi:MAG: alpha/beta hydrolase-fold protein [Planctomycetota bacterium]|nr:alpha/beta hydrolase-fold protein [Planctomycetota bacterium]